MAKLILRMIFSSQEPSPVNSTSRLHTNDTCSSDLYTGSACTDILLRYQSCIPSLAGSSDIHIVNGDQQEELDELVDFILSGLFVIGASEDCISAAVPILCLYYFGLCDGGGRQQHLSKSTCNAVTTDACAEEIKKALIFLDPAVFPSCDILPETTFESHCNGKCTIVPICIYYGIHYI